MQPSRPHAQGVPAGLAPRGGLIMWLLRLTLAPVFTLTGFRAWVLEECPVAPGRRASSTPTATNSRRPLPIKAIFSA
jgi:hypothetical protein